MAHGDVGHLELPADDVERARNFYATVFGWQFTEMPEFPGYLLFSTASQQVDSGGAIGQRGQSTGQQLRVYVGVDSIDDTLRRIEELGGRVVEGRQDVPGQGFFAVFQDTEGNELGLWENLPGAEG